MDNATRIGLRDVIRTAWPLPSAKCRPLEHDLARLKRDLADSSSVISRRLTADEKNGLLTERSELWKYCVTLNELPKDYIPLYSTVPQTSQVKFEKISK